MPATLGERLNSLGSNILNPEVLAELRGYDQALDCIKNTEVNRWLIVEDRRRVPGLPPDEVWTSIALEDDWLLGCPEARKGKDGVLTCFMFIMVLDFHGTQMTMTIPQIMKYVEIISPKTKNKEARAARDARNAERAKRPVAEAREFWQEQAEGIGRSFDKKREVVLLDGFGNKMSKTA